MNINKRDAFEDWIAGVTISDERLEIVMRELKSAIETCAAVNAGQATVAFLRSHLDGARRMFESRNGRLAPEWAIA
jgi:hypothetical protein